MFPVVSMDVLVKEVCISVKGLPGPFDDLSVRYGSDFTVYGCKDLRDEGVWLVVKIEGGFPQVMEELVQYNVKNVSWSEGRKICFAEITLIAPPIWCAITAKVRAVCLSCPLSAQHDKTSDTRFLVGNTATFNAFCLMVEQNGGVLEIKEVVDVSTSEQLSKRQRQILETALQLGYFEFPRKLDLTLLAARLSMRPSSLSEAIRKSSRKLVKNYLDRLRT